MPPLNHLTPCTSTKSNLYFANSLVTIFNDPGLWRLLIFHIPNLMTIFPFLTSFLKYQSKSKAVWNVLYHIEFLWWGAVSTLPNLQAAGLIIVGCPQLLIQYICRYFLHLWGSLVHPQSEDCRFVMTVTHLPRVAQFFSDILQEIGFCIFV